MKKLLQSLLLAILPVALHAQITITNAEIPSVGDFQENWNVQPAGLPLPDSGVNHTWNYSTIDVSMGITQSDTFISPSTTPFAAQVASYSNLAIISGGNYSFLNKRTTGANQGVGVAAVALNSLPLPGSTGPVLIKFSREITQMKVPATYGTSFTTNGSGKYTFSYDTVIANPTNPGQNLTVDSVRIVLTVKANSRINGWGSLSLPGGNSYNVIRQHVTSTSSFGIEVRSYIVVLGRRIGIWVPVPLGIPSAPTQSIDFWANGYKMPIMSLSADSSGQVNSLTFKKDLVTSVSANKLVQTKVWPNPATNSINISAPSGGAVSANKVVVNNVWGNKVGEFVYSDLNNGALDISAYPVGFYSIQILGADNKVVSHKTFIKE